MPWPNSSRLSSFSAAAIHLTLSTASSTPWFVMSAYESLLKSRRQLLHGQIAQTIETKFPEVAGSQPEIVARHFTEAGLSEKAVGYWIKAGHLALSRSANTAVSHLNEGLKQIPRISDAAQRDKLELLLQTALGNSLQVAQGWSSENVKHAYTRALELCKESRLDKHTLPVVFGLWTWNFVHPSLGEAQTLARYLLIQPKRFMILYTKFLRTKRWASLCLHKDSSRLRTRNCGKV